MIYAFNSYRVFVRLGEHNADTEIDCEDDMCAPPVQDFRPVKQFYHRDYQHPPLRHDIALIRLDRPAKLNGKTNITTQFTCHF